MDLAPFASIAPVALLALITLLGSDNLPRGFRRLVRPVTFVRDLSIETFRKFRLGGSEPQADPEQPASGSGSDWQTPSKGIFSELKALRANVEMLRSKQDAQKKLIEEQRKCLDESRLERDVLMKLLTRHMNRVTSTTLSRQQMSHT